MRFAEPSCREVLVSVWESSCSPNVVENRLLKLNICADELGNWNKDTFKHLGAEIKKLKSLLRHQHDAISRKHTLEQIQEWQKKEEILW